MLYSELLNQVAADYADAAFRDVITQNASIGQFIVQYEETDWEFSRRLASHFHTGLVNDVHINCPKMLFWCTRQWKTELRNG